MKKFLLRFFLSPVFLFTQIPVFLIPVSLSSCGPSQQEIAEKKYYDSIDSVFTVEQKHISDSIRRIDSIRNFPCPQIQPYIDMSERAIAILEAPGTVPNRAERYGAAGDSAAQFFAAFMKDGFADIDPICRKRLMALSMVYLQRQTSAINDLDPVARQLFPHEEEDRRTDSIAWNMQFGE